MCERDNRSVWGFGGILDRRIQSKHTDKKAERKAAGGLLWEMGVLKHLIKRIKRKG